MKRSCCRQTQIRCKTGALNGLRLLQRVLTSVAYLAAAVAWVAICPWLADIFGVKQIVARVVFTAGLSGGITAGALTLIFSRLGRLWFP